MDNLESIEKDTFLWVLFKRLRSRGFPLGLDDYLSLWQALRAGFGWSSRADLCNLCCSLWAKSSQEQDILIALFNQIEEKVLPQKPIFIQQAITESKQEQLSLSPLVEEKFTQTNQAQNTQTEAYEPITTCESPSLPEVPFTDEFIPKRSFVLTPQYPLNYRETVQTWRRLRKPVREGPKVELDIDSTISSRAKKGVATPIELKAKYINKTKLLLLIDTQGSMLPFQNFIEEFSKAIELAGNFKFFAKYYFHNLLSQGANENILSELPKSFITRLDQVLDLIEANEKGYVYENIEQTKPLPLTNILKKYAEGACVVIISDAGAARKTFNLNRLLNTLAFLKALNHYTNTYIWLNPCYKDYWEKTTAIEIARHVLMFSLDKDGIYNAVNALRGQVYFLERPL